MSPSTINTLNHDIPPLVPRTTRPRLPASAPIPALPPRAVSKKRLRAERLFPLSLRYMQLSNGQKAALRIRRKALAKHTRQLRAMEKLHEDVTRRFTDQFQTIQAYVVNIAAAVRSVSVQMEGLTLFSVQEMGIG
jgi:predicted GNAT family acetyltransferase